MTLRNHGRSLVRCACRCQKLEHGEGIVAALADVCPDLATMTIEWGFGAIVARDGIDLKTRELVTIASCVTLGHATPQLRAHIEGTLNVGATPEEVVEMILQVALYAGFAAATNAMLLAKDVFATRQPG